MQRLQPLGICMPLTEPGCAINCGNIQIRIFENLQRQTSLPTDLLELQTSTRILRQTAERQISQARLAVSAVARKQKCLTIRTGSDPDHVLIKVAITYQR